MNSFPRDELKQRNSSPINISDVSSGLFDVFQALHVSMFEGTMVMDCAGSARDAVLEGEQRPWKELLAFTSITGGWKCLGRTARCGHCRQRELHSFSDDRCSCPALMVVGGTDRRRPLWSEIVVVLPGTARAAGDRLIPAHYPGPSQLSGAQAPGAAAPCSGESHPDVSRKIRRKKLQNFNLQ